MCDEKWRKEKKKKVNLRSIFVRKVVYSRSRRALRYRHSPLSALISHGFRLAIQISLRLTLRQTGPEVSIEFNTALRELTIYITTPTTS